MFHIYCSSDSVLMKKQDMSKSTNTTETSSDEDQMMKDFLSIVTDEPQPPPVNTTGPAQVLIPAPAQPGHDIFKHVKETMKVQCTFCF